MCIASPKGDAPSSPELTVGADGDAVDWYAPWSVTYSRRGGIKVPPAATRSPCGEILVCAPLECSVKGGEQWIGFGRTPTFFGGRCFGDNMLGERGFSRKKKTGQVQREGRSRRRESGLQLPGSLL